MALVLPAAYYAVTVGCTIVGGLIGGLIGHSIVLQIEFKFNMKLFNK